MLPLRHRRLLRLEKKNEKKLETALLYLLLKGTEAPRTRLEMVLKVPTLSRKLDQAIRGLHVAAEGLANRDTQDFLEDGEEPPEAFLEQEKATQIATAAKSLLLAVATYAAIRVTEEGDSFPEALEGAVADADGRISRIADTETFYAYNTQYLAVTSGKDGEWVWDALLDRRTCPQCESLNGTTWTNSADVPGCPAHSRCRCVIEFFPNN